MVLEAAEAEAGASNNQQHDSGSVDGRSGDDNGSGDGGCSGINGCGDGRCGGDGGGSGGNNSSDSDDGGGGGGGCGRGSGSSNNRGNGGGDGGGNGGSGNDNGDGACAGNCRRPLQIASMAAAAMGTMMAPATVALTAAAGATETAIRSGRRHCCRPMYINVLIDSKFLSSGVMCHVGSIWRDWRNSNFCQIKVRDRKHVCTDRKLSICENLFAICGFGKKWSLCKEFRLFVQQRFGGKLRR